jgi:hypothetical protein
LIIVNGHGGDKYSWYAFYSGRLCPRRRRLTYDPIGEGERNRERKSGTRAHDKLLEEPELGRRMGGLMVTDVMQAVSQLRSRPEVDPKRIAAAGYWVGSFILSLAGAIDERLYACVLTGGGNLDGPGEYWDKSKPMCQALPYKALNFSATGRQPFLPCMLPADQRSFLMARLIQSSRYQRTASLFSRTSKSAPRRFTVAQRECSSFDSCRMSAIARLSSRATSRCGWKTSSTFPIGPPRPLNKC